MDQRRRMKLCPHCEGEVDLDVIVCPFCGKDVSSQRMTSHMQTPMSSRNSLVRSLSPDETLSSLYPPPYRPKVYEQELANRTATEEEEEREEIVDEQIEEEEVKNEKKTPIVPILLFSLGINLCLFGLFLLFFSSNGEVWLHWKGGMWIAYLLLSAPFMYFGYKKMK